MRLTTINERACIQIGELHHDICDLSEGTIPSDLDEIVQQGLLPRVVHLASTAGEQELAKVATAGSVGPPIRRPGTIFGWGLNFADHSTQSGYAPDAFPTIFVKFPSAVTGPHDPIVIPYGHDSVDWEAELAIVIGTPGRRITRDSALDHIAGVMCAQDVSERHVQFSAGTQFCLGKGFDTFCPWGPALVTLDELSNLGSSEITCRLNGTLVQSARIADMLLDVAELTSSLSQFTTLRAGDVILGGSPGGVGFFQSPPRYLRAGDVLETAITGIGSLRNQAINEASPIQETHEGESQHA